MWKSLRTCLVPIPGAKNPLGLSGGQSPPPSGLTLCLGPRSACTRCVASARTLASVSLSVTGGRWDVGEGVPPPPEAWKCTLWRSHLCPPNFTGCVTSIHKKGEGNSFFKQNGIRCVIWLKKNISGNGWSSARGSAVGGGDRSSGLKTPDKCVVIKHNH